MAAVPSTNTKVEATQVLKGPEGEGQPHANDGAIEPSVQSTPAEPLSHPAIGVSNFALILTLFAPYG